MTVDLTERERAVLEARLAGEPLKEIALRLGLHWGTLARYQDRGVRKLLGPHSTARGRRRVVVS